MTVNFGPLRPPRSFSSGRPEGPPRFVVVHYTAGSERSTSAEDGAAYDQRRTDGTSTHYFHDSTGTVQCVDTADRAHAAKFRGNLWGIQHELCGTVQTRAQWLDAASRPTIRHAAKAIALDLKDWGLPLTQLIGSQVRTGRGICGHKDCTIGFWEDHGTHMDPDGNTPGSFPWDVLLADVKEFYMSAPTPKSTTASYRKWPGDHVSTGVMPGAGAVYWTYVLKEFYLVPHEEGSAQWVDHVWRLRAFNDALNGPGQYERVAAGLTQIKLPGKLGY